MTQITVEPFPHVSGGVSFGAKVANVDIEHLTGKALIMHDY